MRKTQTPGESCVERPSNSRMPLTSDQRSSQLIGTGFPHPLPARLQLTEPCSVHVSLLAGACRKCREKILQFHTRLCSNAGKYYVVNVLNYFYFWLS
jgi:hypothetical protein